MAPRSYSIIVVPDDHSGTRQYRIGRALLVALIAVLTVLALTVIVFVATYGRVLQRAQQVSGLEEENASLREQVSAVEELSAELEAMTALRAQVMNMLGSESVEATELVGIDARSATEGTAILDDPQRFQQLFAEASRGAMAPTRWPTPGPVRKEYFAEPEGGQPAHPGLDLQVLGDGAVRASGAGLVVESGYEPDRGHFVAIDHGYGFRTLYAGLTRLDVEAGQRLAAGQALGVLAPPSAGAQVGSGRNGSEHLYFELRVDGIPVDPRRYLEPR